LIGACGADFLCYLTPAEHLGLPTEEDVKTGVITTRMAAHIADIAKGNKQAWARDLEMAKARIALNQVRQIKAALYPEQLIAATATTDDDHGCVVCGTGCAAQVAAQYFGLE
jgi:5-hydroxybenzimidazole synthase